MKDLKRSNIGREVQHIVPQMQLYMMWVAEKHVALGFNHVTTILVGLYVSIHSSSWRQARQGQRPSEVIMLWYRERRRPLTHERPLFSLRYTRQTSRKQLQ